MQIFQRRQRALVAALFFTLPLVSMADERAGAQPESGTSNLVVTANRIPQDRLKVGSTTYVITGEEIQFRQIRQLSDVLRTIPGMTVTQNGVFGGVTTVRHRGSKDGQTLILVDGVTINDPGTIGGGYDFAFLNTDDIERVEVLNGPQSTLYGADAVAGVINIITKSGSDQTSLTGYVEGGSFSTRKIGGQVTGGSDKFAGRLSIDYFDTDGISKADENLGNTEDDAYDNLTVSGRMRLRLSDRTALTATGRFIDSETEYDNGFPIADGDFVSATKQYWGGLSLDSSAFEKRLDNTVSFYFADFERSEAGADNFFPSASESMRAELAYQGAWNFDADNRLLFGAEYEDSEYKLPQVPGSASQLDNQAAYLMAQFEPLAGLNLTVGLRHDSYDTDAGTQDDSETTGRVTAAWNQPNTGLTWRASWGQGFKAPSIFQLTYTEDPMGYPPNPDLKPQTNQGWDLGVEHNGGWRDAHTQLTFFYDDTKNQIDYVFNTMIGAGRYENIDSVRRKGLEFVFDLSLTDALALKLSAAHIKAVNRADGMQLSRVPRNSATLNLSWQAREDARFFVDLTAQSEQDDSPFNSAKVPGFGFVDLGGEWDVSDSLKLFGRIDNLFDREYQEVLGYGMPDRAFFVGVRSEFGR